MSKKGKIIFIVAALLIIGAIVVGVILGLRKIPTVSNEAPSSFPTSSSQTQTSGANGNTSTTSSQVQTLNTSGESSSPELKRLTLLTKGPAMGYWIVSPQILGESTSSASVLQSAVFYMGSNGDVIRIQPDGKEVIVSHFGEAPLRVIQSASGARVVVEFASGSFALYDVSRSAFEFLPQGTVSAAFSPDGTMLAYLTPNASGKQELFIRDLTTTKKTITKTLSLFIDDVKLSWPTATRIYLIPPQASNFIGDVWYFDIGTKTVSLFTSGTGIGALFSSVSSTALIFHNENNSSIAAYIKNTKTGSSTPLTLSTLLSKCAFLFDNSDVVCAIPQVKSKTTRVQLPDDYNTMALFTSDSLLLLSAAKGYASHDIFTSLQAPFDAKDIRARAQQVFFIDRLTDALYLFDMRGL